MADGAEQKFVQMAVNHLFFLYKEHFRRAQVYFKESG